MPKRCLVLLSGGLDSMLAIRIMQEQGIEVEALNFKTIFTCCQDQSAQAARKLDVPLTVLGQQDDYLQVIQKPQFGYGKGANPCVDCRIYMFDRAKASMEELGADFIVSGEVVGQRPMSQKKKDLNIISDRTGLDDLLLRPLSAKLLPPTLPEREGWVDREKLYAFNGRSRKGLVELAAQLGIDEIPAPSSGCALTEPIFSKKVFDLVVLQPDGGRWDYELIKYGRHFRIDGDTKIVVGRNESDNEMLKHLHDQPQGRSSVALVPLGFQGPVTLLVGEGTATNLALAQSLMLRYSKVRDEETTKTRFLHRDTNEELKLATADVDVADYQPITSSA